MSSKEAVTRDEACDAIANLALQCSDTEVIEKIVRHLFGVLNGGYILSMYLHCIS